MILGESCGQLYFLIGPYRRLVSYFRSEQRLEAFYLEHHREEFRSFEQFRGEMEEGLSELPFFLLLVGRPLFGMSMARHRAMGWLYRRTELLQGRWADLRPRRKLSVGTMVVAALMAYGLYLLCLWVLNSVFLSLNTFSTLGFGDIPVSGVSRYLAILEGFLGWFLLSIFSVSLISQIRQN